MPSRYLTPAEALEWEQLTQQHRLLSTGVALHLDWYPQPSSDCPALVIIHGGGGHAGLFARLALAFHHAGYAVAVPDQRGQGRSDGTRGDFSVSEAVQNIVDTAAWVRQRTHGPLYLLGSSIGGGLAYAAGAALVQPGLAPAAIACINLYDFGDPRTGLEFSRFAALARIPGLPRVLRGAAVMLAQAFPRLRLPYRAIADFSGMLDERDRDAYAAWQNDPHALRSVTLRALVSLLNTPPAIPMPANRDLPVLVINPRRDRMVRPAVTRRSFEQLGGRRAYHEIDYGHFSLQADFCARIVALAHPWFAYAPARSASATSHSSGM